MVLLFHHHPWAALLLAVFFLCLGFLIPHNFQRCVTPPPMLDIPAFGPLVEGRI
jgi:hypothetical protein